MDPFVQLVKDTPETSTTVIEDQFQSISAQSQYDKHSHEVRFPNFLLLHKQIFLTFNPYFLFILFYYISATFFI